MTKCVHKLQLFIFSVCRFLGFLLLQKVQIKQKDMCPGMLQSCERMSTWRQPHVPRRLTRQNHHLCHESNMSILLNRQNDPPWPTVTGDQPVRIHTRTVEDEKEKNRKMTLCVLHLGCWWYDRRPTNAQFSLCFLFHEEKEKIAITFDKISMYSKFDLLFNFAVLSILWNTVCLIAKISSCWTMSPMLLKSPSVPVCRLELSTREEHTFESSFWLNKNKKNNMSSVNLSLVLSNFEHSSDCQKMAAGQFVSWSCKYHQDLFWNNMTIRQLRTIKHEKFQSYNGIQSASTLFLTSSDTIYKAVQSASLVTNFSSSPHDTKRLVLRYGFKGQGRLVHFSGQFEDFHIQKQLIRNQGLSEFRSGWLWGKVDQKVIEIYWLLLCFSFVFLEWRSGWEFAFCCPRFTEQRTLLFSLS